MFTNVVFVEAALYSSDSTQLSTGRSDDNDWRLQVTPTEFLPYVETVKNRLSRFKSALSKPFRDIEAS